MNDNLELEKKNLKEGEKIDIDRYTDIFFDCLRMHEKNKNLNGESLDQFENFNEVRKPFLKPDVNKISN